MCHFTPRGHTHPRMHRPHPSAHGWVLEQGVAETDGVVANIRAPGVHSQATRSASDASREMSRACLGTKLTMFGRSVHNDGFCLTIFGCFQRSHREGHSHAKDPPRSNAFRHILTAEVISCSVSLGLPVSKPFAALTCFQGHPAVHGVDDQTMTKAFLLEA